MSRVEGKSPNLDPAWSWDLRPVRIWSALILSTLLIPIGFDPLAFIWDIDGDFLSFENLWMYATGLGLLLASLFLVQAPKARGIAYLLLIGIPLFISLRDVLDVSSGFGLIGIGPIDAGANFLIVSFLFGPPLVAAANRAYRREPDQTVARVLAGLGGLAIVVAFVYPFRVFTQRVSLAEVFFKSGSWDAWPFLLWLLVLLAFGIFGALLLLPGEERKESRTRRISLLARWLPWGLAAVILIMMVISPPRHPGVAFFHLLRGIFLVFGILISLAIGLALLLQRLPRRGPTEPDYEDVF